MSLQVWGAEFKVFRSLEFNAMVWLVQIGDKYLYPLIAEEFVDLSPQHPTRKPSTLLSCILRSPMGEFYRAVDTPKLPRSLAAPVPQQQKQKLEQAEWSRKGASLKKLSVLLDRDVKTFYTTRSDLHQVCLKNFTDTDDDARLPSGSAGIQQGSGGCWLDCDLGASADLLGRLRWPRFCVPRCALFFFSAYVALYPPIQANSSSLDQAHSTRK